MVGNVASTHVVKFCQTHNAELSPKNQICYLKAKFWSKIKSLKLKSWGTHQFDLFCTSTIFIYSTFSVLWPLYFALSTSNSLLRHTYFGLCTSTLSNLDFVLVQKYRSKSIGRSKVDGILELRLEVQKRSNWCIPKSWVDEKIRAKIAQNISNRDWYIEEPIF